MKQTTTKKQTKKQATVKPEYITTRAGEQFEFRTFVEALTYGKHLAKCYGDGSRTNGTAIFVFRADQDEPTCRVRGN